MGRSRYKILDTDYPYFITSSINGKIPLLADAELKSIILNGFKFLIRERSIKMYAYVIMPDHIHAIVEGENLAIHISNFKSYTARSIIDNLIHQNRTSILEVLRDAKLSHKTDREFQVWAEGFHPKQIFSEEVMAQKIRYIHYNPVKAGLVSSELDWEQSSALFYDSGVSELPLTLFGD